MVAVSAPPLVREPVSVAAHGAVDDGVARRIDADEVVHPAREFAREQVPCSTKVACPFLANIAGEDDCSRCRNGRALKRSRNRQHCGEPAAVVADAPAHVALALTPHPHVRALRKHRVEMPLDEHSGATASAMALADHVAHRVDAHVGQPRFPECLQVCLGPRSLLERRGRNLAERNLLRERPRVARLDGVEQRTDVGSAGQRARRLGAQAGHCQAVQYDGDTELSSVHRISLRNGGRRWTPTAGECGPTAVDFATARVSGNFSSPLPRSARVTHTAGLLPASS